MCLYFCLHPSPNLTPPPQGSGSLITNPQSPPLALPPQVTLPPNSTTLNSQPPPPHPTESHSHTHAHAPTHAHTNAPTHSTHALTHPRTHALTHPRTHAPPHPRTHAPTHSHTPTHANPYLAVAFETRGHTFFAEDGLETKNVITGNLAAATRELFVGLSTDATPASYWLVNGDNYVANNIAAGSTHYGFWFFPESKVRGASEFEPGAKQVCPQGTPVTFFGDNEAHNNNKYGLRIFTGKNHNGEGEPGFFPRRGDSCAPVSAANPFEPAEFHRTFSWRNGHNGITFGAVAAIQIVDAVVADNVMRGIESLGADGAGGGAGLLGPWGANLLVRPIFIGHAQDGCPACDHAQLPVFAGWRAGPQAFGGSVRLGLMTPAHWGLTVQNATFINYDRPGMIAVGGFAKAAPPGAGYSFIGNGGVETRFVGTRWVESPRRVRWRWNDEMLLTDVDGTFADQPFCKGCHVVRSALLANSDAFPDCYPDARYGGSVCKPNYRFVVVAFNAKPPCGPCSNPPVRISYRRRVKGSALCRRRQPCHSSGPRWPCGCPL